MILIFFLSFKSRDQRHKWIIYLYVWILGCLIFLQYGSSFTRKKKEKYGLWTNTTFFFANGYATCFSMLHVLKIINSNVQDLKDVWLCVKCIKTRNHVFVRDLYKFFVFFYEGMIHVINFFRSKILHLNYNEVYTLSTQNCNERPTYCSATSLALVYELVLYLILL